MTPTDPKSGLHGSKASSRTASESPVRVPMPKLEKQVADHKQRRKNPPPVAHNISETKFAADVPPAASGGGKPKSDQQIPFMRSGGAPVSTDQPDGPPPLLHSGT